MKIILLAITLIIFSCNSNTNEQKSNKKSEVIYSEKQQPDFDGIYEFKINKTTIKDLDNMVYERDNSYPMNWLQPNVKSIKLKIFKKGKIEVSDASLLFYNDTMVSFGGYDENLDLLLALRAKYPNFYDDALVSGRIDNCKWYNKSILATYYKKFFQIKDNKKYYDIDKKEKKLRADSLRVQNKDL